MLPRSIRVQILFLLPALLVLLAAAGAVRAADLVPLRLVALLELDDQGEKIGYPYALHYDRHGEETYLVSSSGRVTVYNNKFFPVASFGQGRGLSGSKGLTVDRQGTIYVCQDRNEQGRKPRLSLYNQAFFLTREIVYDDIPELLGFVAGRVAVAKSGEIYLAGHLGDDALTAAVVLDQAGKFLRFLRPGENDSRRPAAPRPAEAAGRAAEAPAGPEVAAAAANDPALQPEELPEELAEDGEGPPAGLPDGLRPAGSDRADFGPGEREKWYPARVAGVDIDENGRIYLLSREASHIYVFDAQERYLFKFGIKGGVEGKLSNPVGLAIDFPRRTIYVCDYMRHTILAYDYDSGRFVFEFGGRGLGPLWFNFPNDITVDAKGSVVISDQFNRRLQVINPNMAQRRPLLSAAPLELAGAAQPDAEAQPAPALPETVAPALVTPAPPPVAAMLTSPVAALAPQLPTGMGGVVAPALMASAPLQTPPPAGPPPPPKRLAPKAAKKPVVQPPPPEPPLVLVAPLLNPPMLLAPGAVRLVPELAASRSTDLRRLMTMPAALGVYGPVAALLGIGSWMLYTNH